MIQADTPNLWELRGVIGEVKTKAILVYALVWLAELVNVERNLTEVQIGEIATDILNDYGYMKVEEVKYIFKRAIREEKVFGRLDYNVVMNWVRDYDKDRTELCIEISNQRESQMANASTPAQNAISWEQYTDSLWNLAFYADADAVEKLSDIQHNSRILTPLSESEKHQKELDFKSYYYKHYLKRSRQ